MSVYFSVTTATVTMKTQLENGNFFHVEGCYSYTVTMVVLPWQPSTAVLGQIGMKYINKCTIFGIRREL